MPYIGIDFGTSNSVVADFQFGRPIVVPNHEAQAATPSVVTLRRDGTLAFGQEAKENFDEERSIRSIKRVLGSATRVSLMGQEVRPEQVAVSVDVPAPPSRPDFFLNNKHKRTRKRWAIKACAI